MKGIKVIPIILTVIFITGVGLLRNAQPQEAGTLTVTTTPSRGTIFVDNIFKATGFWSGNLNVGDHIVSFGDVDGYITPFPQTVTVIANRTLSVIGVYRKVISLLWTYGTFLVPHGGLKPNSIPGLCFVASAVNTMPSPCLSFSFF